MSSFTFDDSADFDSNLESFLTFMEAQDPEMTAIFRNHASKLKLAIDEATRKKIRVSFNNSIKAELDNLLAVNDKEVDG